MKIFVENYDGGIERMCMDLGHEIVGEGDQRNLVIFSGGSDVWPGMYGEKPLPTTYYNSYRDHLCKQLFDNEVAANRPMIGICRGAQFLNVASGGLMWQDVDGHAIHGTHEATDDDDSTSQVTSTHHQMMRPSKDGLVITTANISTRKVSEKSARINVTNEPDIEVVWYPKTKCLCYQPHPEYSSQECLEHFLKLTTRFGFDL